MADTPKEEYVNIIGPTGSPMRVKGSDYAKGGYESAEVISQGLARQLQGEVEQEKYVNEAMSPTEQFGWNAVNSATANLPGILGIKYLESIGDMEGATRARALVGGSAETGYGQLGSAAGLIGGLALGGEGALLSKAPLGGIMRAGTVAERLAARVLPESAGLMGSAAKSALTMASRGAAEGALFGLSNEANQAVIRNVPLTVASMAAGMGEGALYGGLAMGGIGAAGKLAGEAIESAAGGVMKRIGAAGARAEAKLAEHAGLTEGQIGRLAERDGGIKGWLSTAREGLEEQGLTWESKASDLASGAKKSAEQYQSVRRGIVDSLDREATADLPGVMDRIKDMAKREIAEPYAGTPFYKQANKAVEKITDSLRVAKFPAESEVGTSWSTLMKTRDMLAKEYDSVLSKAIPTDAGVFNSGTAYKKLVGIIDSEMKEAMTAAESRTATKGLADQYAAATLKKTTMEEIASSASRKAVESVLHPAGGNLFTPYDVGTVAMGAMTGHPFGGLGIVGGRMAVRSLQDVLTPKMMEMTWQNMNAGRAAAQTELVRGKIKDSIGKFFEGGARTATAMAVGGGKRKKESFSRDAYEGQLERTRELISDMHAQRVEQYAQEQARTVNPAMYQAIMDQYNRTRAYVQFNIPPGTKAKQTQSLGKSPKVHGFTAQEMKYKQIMKGIHNGLSVLDDMLDGSVSRDQVLAMKASIPEVHAAIVEEAAYKIAETKEQGKFLPADKIATLGIVLDSPIDSTLTPEFVGAIQSTFIPPQPPQQPPPQDQGQMAQSLMTPIEKALS